MKSHMLVHKIGTSFKEASQLKIITKQVFPQTLGIHGHTERKMDWKHLKGKILCSYQQKWILKQNEKENRDLPFLYSSKKEEREKKMQLFREGY